MGLARFAALSAFVLPALVACHEDNTLGLADSNRPVYTATMSGGNVRPFPVTTTTTASAQLSVRDPDVGDVGRQLTYAIVATNLTSASSVHIHLGGAAIGVGPILVTLYTNPTDTALTSPTLATGTIPESAFSGVGLDSLVALMNIGAAYIDIHADGYPLGIVRGQITRKGEEPPLDLFAASALTGDKVRPDPVETTATGAATFQLFSGPSIKFQVNVTGLTGATEAHIHAAVLDSAGPVAVTLFTGSGGSSPVTGTLVSGSFTESAIQLTGVSMDSLLVLMRSGRTYVDVHTDLNPDGEIRAQIQPVTTVPK